MNTPLQAQQQFGEPADHPKIVANVNRNIQYMNTKFHFKKTLIEETGEEYKRPTLEFEQFPVPSVDGIIHILESGDEKQIALLTEAVASVVLSRAREIINDNENITVNNFPFDELLWEKIAYLPPAERRGGGISKETWEEFGKDYMAVMPGITGKPLKNITNGAKILVNKLNAIKTDKKVVKYMLDQVGLYLQSAPNAETYSDCVQFLLQKGEKLLNADSDDLLANL